MKRAISLILVFGILCSLICTVTATAGVLELSFDPEQVTFSTPQEGLSTIMEKDRSSFRNRDPEENNLLIPGPLTEKCSYYIDLDEARFSFLALESGDSSQYFCVALYAGKEAKGEPVFTDYGPYGNNGGMTTIDVTWSFDSHYDNIREGQYTLVSFTSERRGNTLYAIDGTVFATDVYFYRKYIAPRQGFLMDWETGQPLGSTLYLTLGESYVFAMGRSPVPSYGQAGVGAECDLVSFNSEAGVCFLTPKNRGYTTMTVYYGADIEVKYNVEVCTGYGGHKMTRTIAAGTPTLTYGGCNLSICEECNLVKRTYTPNLQESFSKFKDISKNDWYYSYVEEAVYRKLFNGISETSFAPNHAMTRAMLVTVLWRYEGEPSSSGNVFSDVPSHAWYADAVNWAAENEIVNGVGKGRFDPDGNITREQLTTILYRYGGKKQLDMSVTGDMSSFPDGADVHSWARQAMSWALGTGLVSGVGKSDGVYLMPQGNATRAQVSAILIRMITSLLDKGSENLYPDTEGAVDSGSVETDTGSVVWAYYDTGLLRIGGTGSTPGSQEEYDVPWASYKKDITKVEIMDGIEIISAGTFRDHENLKTVHIPYSVMNLQDSSFENCTSLEEISFPNNLRNIGNACFRGCTSLKEANIPEAVLDNLGAKAFEDCTSLTYVSLPSGIVILNPELFAGCSDLKDILLPVSLETVDFGVFGYCSSLESLVIPPYVKKMYFGTFMECNALENLYIFSDRVSLSGKSNYTTDKFYNGMPFGSVNVTTVWGCSANIRNTAMGYGYTYKDILELY